MDFSKKYISMCKEATELQAGVKDFLKVPFGSFIISTDNKVNVLRENKHDFIIENKLVWMPRVDELCDIMSLTAMNIAYMLDRYVRDETRYPTLKLFNSMEKIMLSVVMMEHFAKEWSEDNMMWEVIKLYGIGTPSEHGFSMAAGLTRNINDMINFSITDDMLKDSKEWFIINSVTSRKLYKWGVESDSWEQISE